MARGFSRIGALFAFCLMAFFGYAVFASPGMSGSPAPFDGNLNSQTLTFASGTTCVDSSGNLRCDVATGKGFQFFVNGTKVFNVASNGDLTIGASQVYSYTGANLNVNQMYGPTNTTQVKVNSSLAAANTQADFLVQTQSTRDADLPLQEWQNGTTRQAYLDTGGKLQLNAQDVAEPTCDAAHRGMVSVDQSGAGVGDILRVCMKGTADTYAWRSAYTAP